MKKYEYKKVRLHELKEEHTNLAVSKLNELGEEGWELVSIVGGECIFKKEVTA